MKELVKDYKRSLRLLSERIYELNIEKRKLALKLYSPIREGEMEELRLRLKPLNSMLNELKAVAKEVEYYYDRSWWRREAFTLNQR